SACLLGPLPSTPPLPRQRILGITPGLGFLGDPPSGLAFRLPPSRGRVLSPRRRVWGSAVPPGLGLAPVGRGVRRVHTGVHTTGEGARGPGTMSFWTQPLNPLWLVGSDDGSGARSCTYP